MSSRASHPLKELTLVRIREFLREPEAVFWTVLFPILITTGLGFAFRSRPEAVLKVAAAPPIAATLRAEPGLDVRELPADEAREALRRGQVALAAEPGDGNAVVLRYDETNPEG